MTLNLHLQIVGILLVILCAMHVFFPRLFNWKQELSRLSLLNRQMFIVHCLFIVLVLLFMGVLTLGFGAELLEPSPLGRVVAAGLTLFWVLRLIAQLFLYDRRLWLGNARRTVIHVWFVGMWVYFVIVFAATLWRQRETGP